MALVGYAVKWAKPTCATGPNTGAGFRRLRGEATSPWENRFDSLDRGFYSIVMPDERKPLTEPYRTFIPGIPYGWSSVSRLRKRQPVRQWKRAIAAKTARGPRAACPCLVRITYQLPLSKFADAALCGPDLDNLTKLFLDEMKQTIFSKPADDSFIVVLEIAKTKTKAEKKVGASVEVVPLNTI